MVHARHYMCATLLEQPELKGLRQKPPRPGGPRRAAGPRRAGHAWSRLATRPRAGPSEAFSSCSQRDQRESGAPEAGRVGSGWTELDRVEPRPGVSWSLARV
eukprot:Amastigsp_a676629_98.p3 type:complete len:102 gc:universal Amastigsp_a676629_98:679-374(-)